MINDSWLDRPLSVAGRVVVRREGGLEARLVDLKRDVALIPRVAIHLNRETNSGVKYDPARDLVALYAAGTGSRYRRPRNCTHWWRKFVVWIRRID